MREPLTLPFATVGASHHQQAALYVDGVLRAGRAPLGCWRLDTAEQLAALPEALAGLRRQHPGVQVCGLLAYDAGLPAHGIALAGHRAPLALVQVFAGEQVSDTLPDTAAPPFSLTRPFQADMTASRYAEAIARIHAYEQAGDCYQVNFAQRFTGGYQGAPLQGFRQLLSQHPAPWASFFQWQADQAVFGVSPECFLRVRGNRIITEPIKGSRPRGDSAAEDEALAQELRGSDKDRAENLMIVDLLRNDLGQVCLPGSIQATPLFELRRFSNVQHLVSTVTGTLKPAVDPLAALLAAFPGGSITGAPKKRAMEIIEELEASRRGFYCGSQFWLDAQGNLDANILIRSFQCSGDSILCHGGGGIVVDSAADTEYRESLFKVEKLMQALDSRVPQSSSTATP